jgi:hypothetical protein
MIYMKIKKFVFKKFGFKFIARYVEDNPAADSLNNGEIVIVGNKDYQKWAYLKCPCSCGNTTMLSLSTKRRPSWQIYMNWMMIPTVHPSVRDTGSCYSHYWIKKGKVYWCRDTGIPFSEYTKDQNE